MLECQYIKTVAFGGYDKIGVLREIELLNTQVCDLSNRLIETQLMLDACKKGMDQEKTEKSIVSSERERLTQVQAKNDTLTLRLKTSEEEKKSYINEVNKFKKLVAELEEKLKNANDTIVALKSDSDAVSISNVFIEAQKSASKLDESVREKCGILERDSKSLAEAIVEEANIQGEQIVYEANQKANRTIADAQNKSCEMNAAINNLRASMLNEVHVLKDKLASVQSVVTGFRDAVAREIDSAEKILDDTELTLKADGIPVFTEPKHYEMEIIEPPISLAEKLQENAIIEDKCKRMKELRELKRMADTLKDESDDSFKKKRQVSEQNNNIPSLEKLVEMANKISEDKELLKKE